MPIDRTPSSTSVIDVLGQVLDKGIVVNAWVRGSVVGIDLLTVEARVVVASIETYLNRVDPVAGLGSARPTLDIPTFWQRPRTGSRDGRGAVAENPKRLKH